MAVTDPEDFRHRGECLWEDPCFNRIPVPSGWLYEHAGATVYVPDYWADHVVEYRERQKAKHGAKLKEDREDDLRLRPASTWKWRKPPKPAKAKKPAATPAPIAMDPEVLARLKEYR